MNSGWLLVETVFSARPPRTAPTGSCIELGQWQYRLCSRWRALANQGFARCHCLGVCLFRGILFRLQWLLSGVQFGSPLTPVLVQLILQMAKVRIGRLSLMCSAVRSSSSRQLPPVDDMASASPVSLSSSGPDWARCEACEPTF